MSAMESQITGISTVYSTVCWGADQRIHQHSALLAFVTGEFPAQRASNAENVSIWWRHQAQLEWRKFDVFCISGKRMPNSRCILLNILLIYYNHCPAGIHWWPTTSRCNGISGNDNRVQCITVPILVKWQSAILTKKSIERQGKTNGIFTRVPVAHKNTLFPTGCYSTLFCPTRIQP